jgi:hypothetical protein
LLPPELQANALYLNEQIAEFRNEHVEHEMQYWRKRETEFTRRQTGTTPEVGMALENGGKVYPERPLRELWISIHEYITDVAKFLGSQIGRGHLVGIGRGGFTAQSFRAKGFGRRPSNRLSL